MRTLFQWLQSLILLLISPLLLVATATLLAITDLASALGRRHPLPPEVRPRTDSATVIIPNWNGRDLLEKYLPSVVEALAGNPANETLVVDNGSTDGSVEFLRENFPQVTVLALPVNLGFGQGSNAGIRQARNDIVVLLNSDMRVNPDFLQPLLDGFTDDKVFAVSCQIFFSDPKKRREETGLTQGWWENGGLRVRHLADDAITNLFPCFYGGGGSCAFDRGKFLELGGFDDLLAPFYLEDTDLGYMAWKRGWKVLYQPRSIVYHEHRGTIGKSFSPEYIQSVLKKNFLLFTWKNVNDWRKLGSSLFFAYASAVLSLLLGETAERSSLAGIWRAFLSLPKACESRAKARRLAAVDDTEAVRRSLGGYYRDRFCPMPAEPGRLHVLFVSPYPIYPPAHGGAVFMYQTVKELARLVELHLIVLLENLRERKAHEHLREICASVELPVRDLIQPRSLGALLPHAVSEFRSADLEWLVQRQIHQKEIDVVQLEYTTMAQYAGAYRKIPSILFEHDIYFQSIQRGLRQGSLLTGRVKAFYEYLRALRYETRILPRLDRVQVCTRENKEYLLSYLPELHGKIDDNLRAGIDPDAYAWRSKGRQPFTMLFLGSFRHIPNKIAVEWFVTKVLPKVLAAEPRAKLIVVGSEPPPAYTMPGPSDALQLEGYVADVREPLAEYAVFVCPILSGSGVRVKLLEAFAAGIPVISTRIGAEGLGTLDGEFCRLADDPEGFAERILRVFQEPEEAVEMARRARAELEDHWNILKATGKLAESYHEAVMAKRRD